MNLNFAENFKRLRKEKNLTQEKVADALGVSSQSISRWEIGICYPDLELLPSIANYFGVSIDLLLSNDTKSKDSELKIFNNKINTLSIETSERIDFVKEYCKKYPENDYYAYHLVLAINRHAIGDEAKAEKYMPLMVKAAERLLDTKYRAIVIELMARTCSENELDKWLDMAPYYGFSRRMCLLSRADDRDDAEMTYVQNGLDMFESLAGKLDNRFPDKMGSAKKAVYQRSVLKIIESFGKDGEIPDGWKMFYAYKQLVLSACLFAQKKTEEGWENFDSAIEKCKSVYSMKDEWLDIGSNIFAGLKVNKDWTFAIDEKGEKHRLFAMVNLSFYNLHWIHNLLTNPCWSWFNSVRDTEKYKAAVEWIEKISEIKH